MLLFVTVKEISQGTSCLTSLVFAVATAVLVEPGEVFPVEFVAVLPFLLLPTASLAGVGVALHVSVVLEPWCWSRNSNKMVVCH